MLFLVRMDVHQPANMPLDEFNAIKATEREYSQDLQRTGAWPHIWARYRCGLVAEGSW